MTRLKPTKTHFLKLSKKRALSFWMISKSIYLARIIGHSLHNIAISIVWQELRFAIAGRKWGRSGFGFRVWAGVGVGGWGFGVWVWELGFGALSYLIQSSGFLFHTLNNHISYNILESTIISHT